MNHNRMIRRLVGHALADGAPLGDLFREFGKLEAAQHADSGDLSGSLRAAGLSEDLCVLAGGCPGALKLAQQQLAGLPALFIFRLPLIQVALYIVCIGIAQLIGLNYASTLYTEMQLMTTLPVSISTLQLLVVLITLGFPLGLLLADLGRVWSWRRLYRKLRASCLAIGLLKAGASGEAWSSMSPFLEGIGDASSSVAELDGVRTHLQALCEQSHARAVSTARLVGVGSLLFTGGLIVSLIYAAMPEMLIWA